MGRISALFLCVALVFAGCGGQASEPAALAPTEDGSFPVTINAANGDVTIEAKPTRIVSLSATATEMLFAIGAGGQVVAVNDQSDFPPGVPTTELSAYEPNAEAVAGYEPDLVLASSEASLKTLDDIGIPLLVLPAATTIEQAFVQFRQLGNATGHVGEAEREVSRIRSDLDKIVATVPEVDEPPSYYHELDATYFTVTSDTFIGQVYALAGLRNIADEATKAATGYPQLSAEYIIEANPDFIFLADSECCNQSPERVSNRPGWDQIAAVERGAVFDVGDDISSRWGPRIVDFLQRVVEAILGKPVN